jgi:hypothetical protein
MKWSWTNTTRTDDTTTTTMPKIVSEVRDRSPAGMFYTQTGGIFSEYTFVLTSNPVAQEYPSSTNDQHEDET